MPEHSIGTEEKEDLALEIAHLLFIDVVGYSKLLVNEQIELMHQLNRAVRGTNCFRDAEAQDKLIRLPTGDGMVLLFFRSPEQPVRCALEIAKTLREQHHIQLRMGIHSGPVNRVIDVNDQINIAGAGINIGQRVMDCGDAGHILLSKHLADDLAHYGHWRPHLHELGEFEVKHGMRVELVNLFGDDFGNPAIPARLKRKRRWNEPGSRIASVGAPSWPWIAAIAAVLICAVALLASFLIFVHRGSTPNSGNSAPLGPEKSIAVLPFVDLSAQKDDEYLSDGLTEQIISALGHIRGLVVVARTSSFAFKNKAEDIREVGRTLHVRHIVEGSVSRGPGRVRVDTRLIDVTNGYQLWSENYNSTQQDFLSLQNDVAQKVATALQVELGVPGSERIARQPTTDPEAYDRYLRARYLLNKRTPESLRNALALFQQAVKKDAFFAAGRAGLADAYILLGKIGEITATEAAERAWPQVDAALTLDDQLADGYTSRGILLTDFAWNWPAGETAYRKALELDPNNADAHNWYARHLAQIGRAADALREVAAAQKLDPLSPAIKVTEAKILFVAHHPNEAIDASRQALQLEPEFAAAYSMLGQSYAHLNNFPKAIQAAQKYVELSHGDGYSRLELAYAYAKAGDRAASERIVRDVTSQASEYSPYDMATICAAMDKFDAARFWLEKALQQRSVDVVWIRVDPRLDPIRSNPKFSEVVAEMKPQP